MNGTLFPSFRGDWNTYSLIAPDGTQGPEVSLKTTDGEIVAQTTVNNGIAQLKTERGDYFLQFGAAALPDETERQVKELKILAYESVNSVTLPDSLKIPEDSGLAATVTASSETELSHAVDVLDDDLDTKWAASGEHWILFDFGETKNLTSLSLATYLGNQRQYQFDVQVSDDGENFRTVLQGAQTSGTTLMPEVFELSNAQGRYARIDGHGYVGGGTYNSYSRVRFFDDPEEQKAEQFVWKVESQTVFRQGTKAYITVGAYDYNQQKIEDRPIKLTYTSSAPDIASVNENGVIQFLKAGTVTITVMAECDHVIRLQSIELTVEPGEP